MPAQNKTEFRTGYASVACAGSNSGNATVLTAQQKLVSLTAATGSAGAGVRLASNAGDEVRIFNSTTNTALIYPPTGGSINGSTNSTTLATLKTVIITYAAVDVAFLTGG